MTTSSSAQYFLARQPILDHHQTLFAYELLFRDSSANYIEELPSQAEATARVLANAINQAGLSQIVGNHLAFINIDQEILNLKLFDILDPKIFVLEILESADVDENLVGLVRDLHEKGFRIALDDFLCSPSEFERAKPLWPFISIVKIDLMECLVKDVIPHLAFFRDKNIDLLAEKVEEYEQFEECSKLGFRYFQGYFFAKPKIISGKKLDPAQQGVMELIQLLQQEADVSKLEIAFKKHSSLMVFLLKFINSAAFARVNRIETIRQAIGMVGRDKLKQWLLLLLCAGKGEGIEHNPLAHISLLRAKLIEALLQHTLANDKRMVEKGFLTGVLSKLDVTLNMNLKELFSTINVSEDIQEAVIEHQGTLGTLLRVCELNEIEGGIETEEMKNLLKKINLSVDEFSKILLSCIRVVNQSFT